MLLTSLILKMKKSVDALLKLHQKLRDRRHPETRVAVVGGAIAATGSAAEGGAAVPTAAAKHAV